MKPTIHFYLATFSVVAVATILVIVLGCGIPCKLPQIQIDQINNTLLSINTSAFCSIVFYYILVYLPEKQKARIIQSSIIRELEFIVSEMNWIFAVISKTHGSLSNQIQEDDLYSNLNFEKFNETEKLNIPNKNPIYGEFQCSQLFQKQKQKHERLHWKITLPIDIQEHKKIILQNLTTILLLPSSSSLDLDLVEKLIRLRTSDFLTQTAYGPGPDETYEPCELFGVGDFYKIYLDLIKLKIKPGITYKLSKLI